MLYVVMARGEGWSRVGPREHIDGVVGWVSTVRHREKKEKLASSRVFYMYSRHCFSKF